MPNMDHYDEKLLIRRIADGDEKAFALLVSRYWNNIYSQALAYVKSTHRAQDIVQEVFLKVWENRKTLTRINRFDSFLFIIARNHIISELRKKLLLPLNHDLLESLKEESSIPDKTFSQKQMNKLVTSAVNLLPQQQKTAFLLSREQGLSYEAIAAHMGISKETVKKHIGRALNFLRTFIRTNGELDLIVILPAILSYFQF